MQEDLTVLVVDDDPLLSDMLEDLFSGSGWCVVTARSAEQAFEVLENNRVDVVLTDLNLSAGSGFEILELLAAWPRPLPAILMTAFASDEVNERARELGACATLNKPFQNKEAIEAVRRAFRHSAQVDEASGRGV